MIDVQSIVRWFLSDDNGTSSETIVAHMTGCTDLIRVHDDDEDDSSPRFWGMAPSDPSDLGRCLRLLERYPEWKLRIQEMAVYGPDWAGICAQWDVIVASMQAEVGIDWSKGKNAAATYRLMELAIAEGYRRDPAWECTYSEDGTLSSTTRKQPSPLEAASA
jgi:hypothetical protein